VSIFFLEFSGLKRADVDFEQKSNVL